MIRIYRVKIKILVVITDVLDKKFKKGMDEGIRMVLIIAEKFFFSKLIKHFRVSDKFNSRS